MLEKIKRPLFVGLGLFMASLIIRLGLFLLFPHPAYPDSFYYEAVARSLASGHGFSVNYLWSFIEVGSKIPLDPSLPLASNAHWMPLASVIQVPFIWLLGPTDFASALPFMLLAAGLAPFTYFLARDLGSAGLRDSDWGPLLAGVLMVVGGFIAIYLSQTDNFALYALLVGGVLWIFGRLLVGKPGLVYRGRALGNRTVMVVAGVLTGLAFLSRNDGIILPLAIGVLWLVEMFNHHFFKTPKHFTFGQVFLYGLVSLIVVTPWLVRQEIVFASLSPSGSTGRILWIRYYNEMFAADGPLNINYLLSWGWGNLFNSRLDALNSVGVLILGQLLWVFMAPFTLFGLRAALPRRELRAFWLWLTLFIAWSVILAAPHLGSGNFIHSAVTALPWFLVIGVEGLLLMTAYLHQRWARFSLSGVRHKLGFLALMAAIIMSGICVVSVEDTWASYRDLHQQAVNAIVSHGGEGQVVMSADPGLIWSLDSAEPGIQMPTSDLTVIEQALKAYHVHWLILERQHIVASMVPILTGQAVPPWSMTPVLTIPQVDNPTSKIPELVVYQILDTP
jgi:4-amino-4-deoxy-L-arabinose transferase-like glycosyltransferase